MYQAGIFSNFQYFANFPYFCKSEEVSQGKKGGGGEDLKQCHKNNKNNNVTLDSVSSSCSQVKIKCVSKLTTVS